jgi:hypothetical protein
MAPIGERGGVDGRGSDDGAQEFNDGAQEFR